MKKNNKLFIAILLIFCIFTFSFIGVKADSGWDTDYDSGGWDSGGSSWDSGGSSWDSGSDSSDGCHYSCEYSSDGSDIICGCTYSDEFNNADLFVLILFIIFFISVLILSFVKEAKSNDIKTHEAIDKELLNTIPDFNNDKFLDQCLENFIKLQNAWSDFDYDGMKSLLSDELYNNYVSQLKTLSIKKQKNVMSDFVKEKIYITDFRQDAKVDTIEVILSISFFDYVIDKDENVVRGNNKHKVHNTYKLTFSRKVGKKKLNTCPNCGAKLKKTHTFVCDYCKTTITNNNHDWVLVKKEII